MVCFLFCIIQTLEKLKQFQTNLLKAKMESSNNETGKEEKEEDSGWLVHRLEFSTDKQKVCISLSRFIGSTHNLLK